MAAMIFDLDGTLVQSAAAIRDVANELMAELDLPPLDIDETKSYVGNGIATFLERALTARDALEAATYPDRLKRLERLYAAAPGAANLPFEAVSTTLDSLHAAGHRLAICTNKPEIPTRRVIDANGWTDLFAVVIAGDTLPWRKPDPRPLSAAIDRLGGGPAVYVGDSQVDAATAAAADVPFIFFTEGYCHAPAAEITASGRFSHFDQLESTISTILN